MEHDTKVQKSQVPTSAAPTPQFQPRPFAAESESVLVEQEAPDLQAKSEQTKALGHSLANMNLSEPATLAAEPQSSSSRLMRVQPKLTIGAVGDRYEQEADQVAAQVVQRLNAPKLERSPSVQREALPEEEELQMKPILQREAVIEEEELQMKPTQEAIGRGDAPPDLESAINSARGNGQSMGADLQAKMGEAIGADFSSVKIHTDSQSDQMNRSIQAKAFTTGQDIFFRQGAYDPGSSSGQELIAHELTHVVQQSGNLVSRSIDHSAVGSTSSSIEELSPHPLEPPQPGISQQAPIQISRLAYNDSPTTWNPVDQVKRSGEGAQGVYFVNKGSKMVVVKPSSKDTGNVEFANKFLKEGMGFETPEMLTYSKNSSEGQAITNLLKNPPNGEIVKGLSGQVEEQIEGANYYSVMSSVEGRAIQTLSDLEAAEFIQNASALQDVGRLMASDAFLGNVDRLAGQVNLCNFFYQAAKGLDPGKVATIDNDSSFGAGKINKEGNLEGDLETKQYILDLLIDPTRRTTAIGLFIKKFRNAHKDNKNAIAAVDDNFVQAQVSVGVDKGLADLAEVFTTNIELVRSLKSVNEKYGEGDKRDLSAGKGLAHYVEDRISKHKTKEKATAQLKKYVTYRAKRSKASNNGFKWLIKVGYCLKSLT
jgi:Domain of unknown function (DUF4157)/Actin-fragmin kinase, catalytic